MPEPTPPSWLRTLANRYDPEVFGEPGRRTRIRLATDTAEAWDVVLADGSAWIEPPSGRFDARISADAVTWGRLAADARGGVASYLTGKLSVRRNLHAGVGFLAATSGATGPARLRFRYVKAGRSRLSIVEAGQGPPVLAIHGLGATKGSFVPTAVALADRFRVIAVDLPGFGDSDKPIGAAYDPRFFAVACAGLLDQLDLASAHVIGNSLGGRIALELALAYPHRVGRLALLAPSLAWRRTRPWTPLVRVARPELGLVQVAPRRVVDGIVRRLIPGAADGWAAAGVDEFLRAYLTPAGRAAFYAAARHIYLEEPHGERGFWTRLAELQSDALFIWGRRDQLVPIAFERHVADRAATTDPFGHRRVPCRGARGDAAGPTPDRRR
jgi:pimeloyl-ACP methyl ester carboxylesterase